MLRRTGIDAEVNQMSAEQAKKALKSGKGIKLINGWKISSRRVSGETRYELDAMSTRGMSAYRIEELKRLYGIFSEKIGWADKIVRSCR